MKHRVEVLHGVNLDSLGRRDPAFYPRISLTELEVRVKRFASELGLDVTFAQTNHEGEFCELLHRAPRERDPRQQGRSVARHHGDHRRPVRRERQRPASPTARRMLVRSDLAPDVEIVARGQDLG